MFLNILKSSLTETSIFRPWKKREEQFWHLRKTLGKAELLERVPSPDAPNINNQSLGPSGLSWIFAWSDLIGYDFQGHVRSSLERMNISRIGSFQIETEETSQLRKKREPFILWWFSSNFNVVFFAKFDLCESPLFVNLRFPACCRGGLWCILPISLNIVLLNPFVVRKN